MNIERKFGWQLSKENVLSERALLKNKAIIYVALVYSFVFISWILSLILLGRSNKTPYSILFSLFSFFPLLSSQLTRIITKDKSPSFRTPLKGTVLGI